MTSISIHTHTRLASTGDFTRATPQSVAVMQLGGTLTTPGYERKDCRICQHPAQQYIETWLARHWSLSSINRALRSGEAQALTTEHVDSHLRICIGSENGYNTLFRWKRSQSDEAPTIADRIEEAYNAMLTEVEQAIDIGQFAASMKASDMIKVLQIGAERALSMEDQLGEGMYQQLLSQYWDTVRENTTPEQQRTIAKALDASPAMRQIIGKTQEVEPLIIEAEGTLVPTGTVTAWDTAGYQD